MRALTKITAKILGLLLLAGMLVVPLAQAPARAATLDQEDLAAIEQLVQKGVAKRLAPIRKELVELQQQRIGPTEIAGGIGYIIGIGGLLAYAASRKRKD